MDTDFDYRMDFIQNLDHTLNEGSEMLQQASDLAAESAERAQARRKRLIPLGEAHFFDPLEKIILLKTGNGFRNLGHNRAYSEMAAKVVEEGARRKGFVPVIGGLFWNPAERQLFVKNGAAYVLYSLDRRTKARAEGSSASRIPKEVQP
jgi:hypothetical protein